MFHDRNRRAGRFLEWKVRLFSVAAMVAVFGIYLENRWLTGAAIVILVAGLGLRFLPADPEDEATPGEE